MASLVAIMVLALAGSSRADETDAAGAVRIIESGVDRIEIAVNKGALVRLPRPASSVFVSDPEYSDIAVQSPMDVYVTVRRTGTTSFFAIDDDGAVQASIDIVGVHDIAGLQAALHSVPSGAAVEVRSVLGGLLLSGRVYSAEAAAEANRIAERFLADDEVVVNRLKVAGPNQVNLRVRIAEVSRDVLKRLGFHLDGLLVFGEYQLGLATGRAFLDQSREVIERLPDSGLAHLVHEATGANHVADVSAIIDALETEGLISLLAEPNLTALSGETANFLAGGEFPIPVVDRQGAASVEFKSYGVSLAFTPTVLSGNRINLRVMPEVSSISSVGAVTLNSVTIPALTTRRASTSVELASGQSFAIAGLLQADSDQNVSEFPGLADLPILGALFRSTEFHRRETELVVIVTPYVVHPVSSGALLAPTDGFEIPDDFERIVHGRTHRRRLPGSERFVPVPGHDPATLPGGFVIR